MKNLILLFSTMLFTIIFPPTSFSDWTKVSENDNGKFYVDFDRIKKVDGYVYWWELGDFKKKYVEEFRSYIVNVQGDCKLSRYKFIYMETYSSQMGKGDMLKKGSEYHWRYPIPKTSTKGILKSVCAKVN